MSEKCLTCKQEVQDNMFCDNCWTIINPQTDNGRERDKVQIPLYFPTDYSDDCSDKKSYEMRQIHPSGKNAEKYRWFICSPDFPSDKHKINNPHCHAWTDDKKGEARISLNLSTHEIEKFKIKWGKIKITDQNEIRKLVGENKKLIYQEWEKEWIPAYKKYYGLK